MVAASRFVTGLPTDVKIFAIKVTLFGSLALTGRGHGTDVAVVLGLTGHEPATVDPNEVASIVSRVATSKLINVQGNEVPFSLSDDILFEGTTTLEKHPNALRFEAVWEMGEISRTFYSIGGGAIVEEGYSAENRPPRSIPFPYWNAASLLTMCDETKLSIAALQMENEAAAESREEVENYIDSIWEAMNNSISRGLASSGTLPGGLRVRRRAAGLLKKLQAQEGKNERDPLLGVEWLNLYALAVNEENAAGGRIVTAPTNGAAGILPAVLKFHERFHSPHTRQLRHCFFLTAAAIGAIIKRNASISGAEVGCQGEVGSACAMAAAGLAAVMGGDCRQIENAAEIALEHNLGLTCDPVAGLVQIPCIERNAIAAVKAVNAARLAMHSDGRHHISLDQVVQTMLDTGCDMLSKYKETSQGGLAVNFTEC